MFKTKLEQIINETLKDQSELKYGYEEIAVDGYYDLDFEELEKEFNWL